MTSKKKLMLILLAFGMLLVTQVACNDTNDVPDVGEETLDEMAEDTVDAVKTAVSTACTLCTAVNGEGSDSCTGVCK